MIALLIKPEEVIINKEEVVKESKTMVDFIFEDEKFAISVLDIVTKKNKLDLLFDMDSVKHLNSFLSTFLNNQNK